MSTFTETKENLKGKSLEELLEFIEVLEPGMWKNQATNVLGEWWAVATDLGIIAYFGCEVDAFTFRLDYINRILNS